MPNLLTSSVGTTSKTPGFRRLVNHKGVLRGARASDLPTLRRAPNNSSATDGEGEHPRECFLVTPSDNSSPAACVMCSFRSRNLNRTPRAPWEVESVLVISKLRMQERQWNPADSRYQDQVNTRLAGGKGQPSIPVPGDFR